MLSSIVPDRTISRDQFLKELAFSTVGLNSKYIAESDLVSFVTLSTKTRVIVHVSALHNGRVDLGYDFQALSAPVLDGQTSFNHLRKTLLARVENALQGFDARKRKGDQPPFQVFVDHKDVPLNVEGVSLSRRIVTRVVDALEGS